MADNYAPTTQHVRAVWLDAYPDEFRGQGGAAFDRFIAALRAEWEAEQGEQWDTIVKLRDQIEEARNAWWSATEQGDDGLVYTDRIEDAMDDIWSAIGHADWVPVDENGESK